MNEKSGINTMANDELITFVSYLFKSMAFFHYFQFEVITNNEQNKTILKHKQNKT